MGSIPNGSAPLQACARQMFKTTLPGRTRGRKFIPACTSTYWYRQMTKSTYEYVRVRTFGSTWQYLTVHGSTWQYMAVHDCTFSCTYYVLIPCWYVLISLSTNFMAVLLDLRLKFSLLKALVLLTVQANTSMQAQTGTCTFGRGSDMCVVGQAQPHCGKCVDK
jgi:hypothetical protein